jgi:hydroxypyruvate isomerase
VVPPFLFRQATLLHLAHIRGIAMHRRTLLQSGLATLAALSGSTSNPAAFARDSSSPTFCANFAPHLGLFDALGGTAITDQLSFMHKSGFRAIEDNGFLKRPAAEQHLIAQTLKRLQMSLGVIVGNFSTMLGTALPDGDAAAHARFLQDIESAARTARSIGARWITVVMGAENPRAERNRQLSTVIGLLRKAAAIVEPLGVVMVLEPLCRVDGFFLLRSVADAALVCRAVDSPACKILCDLYHEQVSRGDLIATIDACWDQIAYVQIADNPGRKEPGTGEINYANIIAHLLRKGYQGVIGMEHAAAQPGRKGEENMLAAYRTLDQNIRKAML